MSGLDELTKEELIELVLKLHETVQLQAERISELEEQISKLGGGKPKAHCVKPNAPAKEPGRPRKKRAQPFARKSLAPAQVVCHAVDTCPKCSRKLSGGWVKWKHQVTDIPPVEVDVTDHLFIERECGVCGTRYVPSSSDILSEIAVGKRSIGINLMCLIAHLKTVCLVPIAKIRTLLYALLGVNISKGEIAELLCAVSKIGESEYEKLRDEIRGSPFVHGDETGWRENGKNGYLWSFSTPRVRYFIYDHSRGGRVVTEALTDEYMGTVVADFYGGYNAHDGLKQRCWVHFDRDLDALEAKYPDDASVAFWVDWVLDVYYRAKETTACITHAVVYNRSRDVPATAYDSVSGSTARALISWPHLALITDARRGVIRLVAGPCHARANLQPIKRGRYLLSLPLRANAING